MGLFDLDEYKRKKKRADESATAPRAFPVAFADALFDGRSQKLRFEPVLLDGGHVFISFRPEDADAKHDLIAGGGNSFYQERPELPDVPEALLVQTNDAFSPDKWLKRAANAVGAGHFGRLVVEQNGHQSFDYHFFGSTGVVNTEHYLMILDGSWGRFLAHHKADYDPNPNSLFWAKSDEAADLLIRLDANEFALHLEHQLADVTSIYSISSRWEDMDFEEKHALLPDWEKQIERDIVPLMRAVVWSDPLLSFDDQIVRSPTPSNPSQPGQPFWRRPRFWIKPDRDKGEAFHLAERFEKRILKIWPHIVAQFWPQIETLQRSEVHPAVLYWMEYRGAYLVKFESPNAHEHLESRLLLRDFLFRKGVSLDAIDAELAREINSN